jgi:ATP-dependent RNA helicase DeaD
VTRDELAALVGPELASALDAKGYDTLTTVQQAVLEPGHAGRDLRITSQTGSGKTIAIGFVVRDLLAGATTAASPVARPRVLILAPTRELAKQVGAELSWLYAPLGARVGVITGGGGYLEVKKALSSNPAVLVGTPGRLRDTLERGRIDASALGAVVLDEADSMLDLGFREDLDAILAQLPTERRSHLVSATFSRDVVALADRFQHDPVHVQGTRLGEANVDIEHVIHLVEPFQRVDALINLLLADEDAKTLVFARTRADVARITGDLAEAGFVVRTLSGEMDQPERDQALAAFRQGGVQALVATDVAARGLDVRDVARVIQVEPPTNVETYTHRSGRTGRAGKQGTSVLFVSPGHYAAISRGLARAKIAHRVEPIPQPDAIQRAREEKLVTWLGRAQEGDPLDPHAVSIAEKILASEAPRDAVARLIARAGLHGPTRARVVRTIAPPLGERGGRDGRGVDQRARRPEGERPVYPPPAGPRAPSDQPPRPPRGSEPPRAPSGSEAWVPFRVTWGGIHGADARRLLALACRRGKITGADVGSIRVEATSSIIEVNRDVAETFAVEAARPDPRDPRVRIQRVGEGAPPEDERPRRAVEEERPRYTPDEDRPRRAPHTAPPPPPVAAEAAPPAKERPVRRIVKQAARPAGDAPPRRKPAR